MTFRPINENDDAVMAEIIRRNLKKNKLDIPGTAYYDAGLDKLSEMYGGPECNYYVVCDDDGRVVGGIGYAKLSFMKDTAELQKLSNVKLLGYVTDGQVKTLMKNCRAFIFPSYYEGFGIPPLEALSVGAKIIVGKAASLPEIYKDAAIYIDPYNTDCNLEDLLSDFDKTSHAEAVQKVLSEYSYDKAAQKLYNVLIK